MVKGCSEWSRGKCPSWRDGNDCYVAAELRLVIGGGQLLLIALVLAIYGCGTNFSVKYVPSRFLGISLCALWEN